MKFVAAVLLTRLPILAATGAAFWLCLQGVSGWGWFIFLAMVLAAAASVQCSD